MLVISSFFINPIFTKANDVVYYENQQKGDLSCPGGVSSDKCKMYDAFGNELNVAGSNVWEVRVTEQKNDVEVTKSVKKTNIIGRFEVKFYTKGINMVAPRISKGAYVVIIRDASASLSQSQLTASTNAIKNFVNRLSSEPYADYYFALIQFGKQLAKSSINEVFHKNSLAENVRFCSRKDTDSRCSQGEDSNIDYAIEKANSLLKTVPSDASKWVIIVGDGRYWYKQDMSKRKNPYMIVYSQMQNLRKNASKKGFRKNRHWRQSLC